MWENLAIFALSVVIYLGVRRVYRRFVAAADMPHSSPQEY